MTRVQQSKNKSKHSATYGQVNRCCLPGLHTIYMCATEKANKRSRHPQMIERYLCWSLKQLLCRKAVEPEAVAREDLRKSCSPKAFLLFAENSKHILKASRHVNQDNVPPAPLSSKVGRRQKNAQKQTQ